MIDVYICEILPLDRAQNMTVILEEGPIHSVLQELLGWPTLQRNTCNTQFTQKHFHMNELKYHG